MARRLARHPAVRRVTVSPVAHCVIVEHDPRVTWEAIVEAQSSGSVRAPIEHRGPGRGWLLEVGLSLLLGDWPGAGLTATRALLASR